MRLAPYGLAAVLVLTAGTAVAQGNSTPPQPRQHPTVDGHPPGGTANSSAGRAKAGGNAGNSAAQPEGQRGRSASPSERNTEAPSLEQRVVPPSSRPDQQQR